MGKRIGQARLERLLESLKRDIDLSGSKLILDGSSDNVNRMAGRSPDRYYLEEYFKQKPSLNADLDSGGTTTTAAELTAALIANKDFQLEGTNAATTSGDFEATYPGIKLTTGTTEADQCIIRPHADSDQSAWNNIAWATHAELEWECSLTLDAVDNQAVWAGLKLTSDHLAATDANQIYFVCRSDGASGLAETLSTTDNAAQNVNGSNMQWHCIYSIAGVDYTTNLGLAVAADTQYHLKIVIDSDRKAAVYINGTQYGLVNDSGHQGQGNTGTTATWGQTDTLINGSSAGSTSTGEIAITVDGVDARSTFKALDYVYEVGSAVPAGQVKSVDSATQITLYSLDSTMADNDELYNFGQKATSSDQKSKALTTDINLMPVVGIEAGDAAAEVLYVHYTAINRKIADS